MISKIIANRRAVYPAQYNMEEVTVEEIKTILQAANWAPTHRRTEPWRFIVFHSKESRGKLAEFLSTTYKEKSNNFSEVKYKKYQVNPVKAACVIAICFQRDPKESIPEWEEIASTAMAVQNMWLTASEMKIGAYWSSPSVSGSLGKLVDMNTGERCIGFFYLGKYDGELPEGSRQTTIDGKTRWV
ncbi:nitroreductase [Aureisphaera sp. CAU 1614]|uniref:Nitroreductase n=1 Tax=Halomarinibacterium sedimenti TaxID=2857106 RepID=A0A9X1FNL9_9FLAO|nr:nitroreductase [Halomarinibacterium sedimenti]MBW2936957.1 nitroreductase [Halomarinibacterium sedimenti]